MYDADIFLISKFIFIMNISILKNNFEIFFFNSLFFKYIWNEKESKRIFKTKNNNLMN